MKRRSFLASIAGLIAAPLVAKKAVAEAPKGKPYVVTVDWVRDRVEIPDDTMRKLFNHLADKQPDGACRMVRNNR